MGRGVGVLPCTTCVYNKRTENKLDEETLKKEEEQQRNHAKNIDSLIKVISVIHILVVYTCSLTHSLFLWASCEGLCYRPSCCYAVVAHSFFCVGFFAAAVVLLFCLCELWHFLGEVNDSAFVVFFFLSFFLLYVPFVVEWQDFRQHPSRES